MPETEDELYTVARYLGAPKEMVRVARQATEADVKKQKLDQYQVVYFATHGLVAGDLEKIGSRFAEPALALTIPSRASKLDDGLLTASEIAKLKLNADWVILSACNTAIDGRPESEALSGLSKAFLYAGSRALLVSHWPVYSDAAVTLTTRLFRELKDNSKVDKAEALRLSMLALMNDESDEINPYPGSWAPFIVVGDGR
ncbi:MAG: CHAT domain-containing protein [Methyloligellaceae bacterium]